MHNFLFGNRRTSYSNYSPFGSYENLKPGIITKIKKKIQGLFQPTINSQSLIQRIQSFEDKNLEQELSNQFKNNLVLIDRIIPNKEDNATIKRMPIFPFEQYLKEEFDSPKKLSKQTQTDLNNKQSDLQIKTQNTKKQKKFKKDHSKIYKNRKMEENPKQLEFNLNNQNVKQNFKDKFENSSEYLSNQSNKKVKQYDSSTESSKPIKQQKGETSDYLSPVKLQDNKSNNQNAENQNQRSDSCVKGQKASLSSPYSSSKKELIKNDLNTNQKLQNQTESNTQEDGKQIMQTIKNGDFQLQVQDDIQNLNKDLKISNSHQNQDQMIQNIQESNHDCFKNVNQKQDTKNVECINQNQKDEIIDMKNENIQFQKLEGSISNLNQLNDKCQRIKNEDQNKEDISIIKMSTQHDKYIEKIGLNNNQSNLQKQIITQSSQSSEIQNKQEKTLPQVQLQVDIFLNKSLKSETDKQDNYQEKQQKLQSSQAIQSKENQKNILQTSFLNNQNKQSVDKSEKLLKDQNPFLVQSPNISYDQISLYFQSSAISNENKQCQSQNQNLPTLDFFKASTQQSQQILNKVQDKYNSQNNIQQSFGNPKILQYSTNKQMEIIEQVPQTNQCIQNQSQIFESAKLNYQQQPTQQYNLFQQQQQQQQQNYPQQLIQQQNFQIQNLFSQQQQTSNQVSSLNLFQSNPYQQQQNEIMNKPVYLKNDVLSLFQDTKKHDRDIFQVQQNQQTSQSLNNSFNKGRKKQRINNF